MTMKIDDYISLCRVCAEDLRDSAKRFNNTDMKKDAIEWDEAADMFEELQWYRRQDLIRREDVLNCRPEWLNENMDDAIKSTHNKGWNECNSEWYDTIIHAPKAECGGEVND